jgi:hypothetical protein
MGGATPYTYEWYDSSTADSLVNLPIGFYTVKIQDNKGCIINKGINLVRDYIQAKFDITNEGCKELGSIHTDLIRINAPYTLIWSNSVTEIDNDSLTAGFYNVTISDSKNCLLKETVCVKKDTVILFPEVSNVSCFGMTDGYINLLMLKGEEPFIYNWDSGEHNNYLTMLEAGTYKVEVIDAFGCKGNQEINITQPDEITYDVKTTPDNENTLQSEGKIMISDIAGGTPPYKVYWYNFYDYAFIKDGLPSGAYCFLLLDDKTCRIEDTAYVTSIPASIFEYKQDFRIYPNPLKDNLYIEYDDLNGAVYNYELLNQNGQVIRSKMGVGNKIEKIEMSDLKSGVYILRLIIDAKQYMEKLIVE